MNGMNMSLKMALATGTISVALLTAGASWAQDGETATFGPQTYAVEEFDVDGFVGTIELIVEDRGDIEISARGPADRMDQFEVDESSDRVEVSYHERDFRWNDWSTWLGWWHNTNYDPADYPFVTVRLPAGTPVDVEGMTGDFTAGDLNSALSFGGAGAVDASFGNLRSMDLAVAGAADVRVGDVSGLAEISVTGSGDVTVGSAENAAITIRGSGDVSFAEVRGGLDLSISGRGNVDVASVNGPVDIRVAGSGDVDIEGGYASSFDVSISGSGDVAFRGMAVNPDVSIAGSGNVYIERYEGHLNHSGMGDVNIGSGS